MLSQIHDKKAEEAALGSCFIGGIETLDEIAAIIKIDDFHIEKHRMIFEAALNLRKQKRAIDIINLVDELKGKVDYADLVRISNSTTTFLNATDYANIIKNKSLARQNNNLSLMEMDRLESGEDSEEVISQGILERIKILSHNKKSQSIHIKDLFLSFYEELEARSQREGLVGISSGYDLLDECLGGFYNGGMYIIGARPKMGKTTFAINLAINISKMGIPVYFKSLEMTKEQLEEKFTNVISMVESYKLKNPKLLAQEEWKMIARAGNEFEKMPIFIDDTPVKASKFIIDARRWKAKNPNGILIADYIQRFKPESKGNKYEQVSDISNILCDGCKEMNAPLIALSQLSREVDKRDDKVPQISDLRESGSLEQDAAAILLLYRDDYYNPQEYSVKDPSLVNVVIPANRFGPTDAIDFNFYKGKSKFVQLKKGA